LSADKNSEHLIYLGIGSNINPRENLPRALALLSNYVRIEKVSSVYKTPSVGSEGPDFLNAVILIGTYLTCDVLKRTVLREIEEKLGRMRTSDKNAPRTIDIDILIEDNELYDDEIWEQAHLAIPLAEINPGYTHPSTKETLKQVATNIAQAKSISRQQNIIITPSRYEY
jgi:2-amino-4-hydroxy-6-hydroxymethyldihydropteridine diphosphokinase